VAVGVRVEQSTGERLIHVVYLVFANISTNTRFRMREMLGLYFDTFGLVVYWEQSLRVNRLLL
jgi:hypothetical protein